MTLLQGGRMRWSTSDWKKRPGPLSADGCLDDQHLSVAGRRWRLLHDAGALRVYAGRSQSGLTYSAAHQIIGKSAPPRNMTGLSLTVLNGMANLAWDAAVELDVRNGGQARIRHTTDMFQATWGSAVDIGGYISGAANSAQLPLLEGVYLAKWIDSSGNESLAAVQVATTAPSLLDLNVVATVVEQPLFAGGKANVIRDPALNGIKLSGHGLVDDRE